MSNERLEVLGGLPLFEPLSRCGVPDARVCARGGPVP